MRVLKDLPDVSKILPTERYIRTTEIDLARVAGFPPTTRRGLPSDTVVWNASRVIKFMVPRDEARIARSNAPVLELASSW